MNAQSNALEYAFKRNGVPYKIYGGMKFFDRAEIKDMLAYLCVINNPADDLRLRRIVNVPSRKIGQATVDKAQTIATEQETTLYQVFRQAADYPELKNVAASLSPLQNLLNLYAGRWRAVTSSNCMIWSATRAAILRHCGKRTIWRAADAWKTWKS